ncbi:MAG: maltose alpha-D-glucosyltransferase [Chloroflexi bacterium HGW-Chloroflexi-2]|jgi:maltose alpha-D-glucosyltransferase/alpha-amylase|nr:MAG: maltose alpha-D-glucosyltransferase [Chloroflexi bacterium HGW-Chloroflexi-2]
MTCNKLWYKQAVIYELNVRGFYDANSDGVGDLAGVTAKLDYLQNLGVDLIWLLPIMKSPLRDGGYDVSDMQDINPNYGTMDDFTTLVDETHRRGMKIMVELIPNHTSDQHPWFQASHDPNHPEFQKYKDYYLWSDTDQKFKDARIIFIDYEKSNWTYDPIRGEYYWHRFFYHQPDLNYDNPEVQKAMMRTVQYWIDLGVDAIRVDAPPYLFEREDSSSENLPESHAYYKRLRAFVEAYSPEIMLLAEANQWPEETRDYFGDGDEFHMNFHFPLMPRLFMALAKSDRTPIDNILARTPEIPECCQWGIFLRNHDELTLEMVTEDERQFMWEFYAPDPRMRLNLGIRRRLAPLLDNDQRKIRLMHTILLSFLGSPVLYYGDEIGMGDNVELRDRDGVRTPMQWDDSINGGFSDVEPQKLRIPVIDDDIYGYQTVNVKASMEDPTSLLSWLKIMIMIRKQHSVFGEGTSTLCSSKNKSIIAYFRENEQEKILVIANFSSESQQVALEEMGIKDEELQDVLNLYQPVVLEDRILTLEGYGFRWLKVGSA